MKPDISSLHNFYTTPFGISVQKHLCEKIISFWPDAVNDVVVGYGYCIPYLNQYLLRSDRILMVMPSSQGCLPWPSAKKCSTVLTVDNLLCLENESVNRLIMIHCFEHSEDPRLLLRELWRVLVDEGHFIIVVPNRHRIWTKNSLIPFLQGKSYSDHQIRMLLTENFLTPLKTTYGFFALPSPSSFSLKIASTLEKIGSCWFPKLGGLIVIEGCKKTISSIRYLHSSWQSKLINPQASIYKNSS